MPTARSHIPEVQALQGLHLYHGIMSNCSMRVRLMLEEKALPWESHVLDPTKQENLSEDYLRINPKSLIPSLVHDGTVVTESNDILYYIEEHFPEPSYAVSTESNATMRSWVDLASDLHLSAMKTWLYDTTGTRTKRTEDMARYREIQDEAELVDFHQSSLSGFTREEVAEAVRLNHDVLSRMESALAAGDWLVGDRMSLADIAWFPNVLLLSTFGFPMQRYPAVRAWLDRVRARPSYAKAIALGPLRLPAWLLRIVVRVRRAIRR